MGNAYVSGGSTGGVPIAIVPNAVFDGITDDSAAIQAAFNNFGNTNSGKVVFPPGKTAKINTGLTLISGDVSIDFNGCILDASGMASGYALSVYQDQHSPVYGSYAPALPIENLILVGPNTAATAVDGIFMGGTNSVGSVATQTLRNIVITGFRDGLAFGSYCYINAFLSLAIIGNFRTGINFVGSTAEGECMNFHGCSISDNNSTTGIGGTCVAINMPNGIGGGLEVMLHGCSVDYNDIAFNVQNGVLAFMGCHIEDNHSSNVLGTITKNSGNNPTGVRILGGVVTPTDVSPRAALFNINNSSDAFLKCECSFNMFNQSSAIVTSAGNPHVDLAGSHVNFNGSTAAQVPSLGAQLNCLYNPNAETTNTNGWTTSGTGYTGTADNTTPHSGTYAFKIVSASGNSGGFAQQVPCGPGRQVCFKGWVNVSALSAGSVQLQAIFLAGDAATSISISTIGAGNWSATTSGYVEVFGSFISPPGTAYAKFNLRGTTFTGTMFLDDCEMNVV